MIYAMVKKVVKPARSSLVNLVPRISFCYRRSALNVWGSESGFLHGLILLDGSIAPLVNKPPSRSVLKQSQAFCPWKLRRGKRGSLAQVRDAEGKIKVAYTPAPISYDSHRWQPHKVEVFHIEGQGVSLMG